MADYSTYLPIDGTDMPSQSTHDSRFIQEQYAIYDSCTNYVVSQYSYPVGPVRQVESMQGRARSYAIESTPLMSSGVKSSNPSVAVASSTDSVYEPKKTKRTGLCLALFIVFYLFYLVLGSVAFEGMEVNSEIAEREDFRQVRQRFLQKYSDVLGSNGFWNGRIV